MISATIITLNEEENIEKSIKSVEGLVDEVIVVDCGSTDKTIEIAKKLKAKVFKRAFDNFANQKNWATEKAQGEWILSLDADEQVTTLLGEEIKKAVQSNKHVGYLIPRRNFILGAEIKHSRWNPDKHVWLWKKDQGGWVGEVHEEVIVKGEVGELKNPKLHYSHERIKDFIEANNRYSSLEANKLYKIGERFNFWKMIWQSKFEFIIRFFYKRGFLDGRRGFVLAFLMSMYKLTVWVKLWEQNQNKN